MTKQPKNNFILRVAAWKLHALEFISPLSFVALRVYVGLVFWISGLTKIADFDTTILLFENEYMTHKLITVFGMQVLTPEIAAYMGTFNELVFSILLMIGFGGRLAAFVLLCMTAVIQFTYTSHPDHLVWALMLFPILTMGAGRASWDFFIRSAVYGGMEKYSVKEKLFAVLCTMCLTFYATYLIFTDVVQMQ